jgi:hypothetical protein
MLLARYRIRSWRLRFLLLDGKSPTSRAKNAREVGHARQIKAASVPSTQGGLPRVRIRDADPHLFASRDIRNFLAVRKSNSEDAVG